MTRHEGGSKPTENREHRKEREARAMEGQGRDWADEAAQSRTGDDPRAIAPHDRTGKPSTGEALP